MAASTAASVEPEKRTTGKCLHYLRNIVTFLVSHIGLVSLVVGYCIMGAFTFEALESENEILVKKEMVAARANVTDDLWIMTKQMPVLFQENWTLTATDRLKEFENHLVKSMKFRGWNGNENPESVQWTYAGALFYSIILITTIGYGHIAPKTTAGKVVTIFYAILGIPLMLLCLANIGDAMAHSFRFLYWKVCCYACTRKPKKSRLKRTRTRRSNRQSIRYQQSSRPNSLRRSQRLSQRSADSAMSDSALSRSSYSASDIESKFYDEAERDFEMSAVGPERGRRSQRNASRKPTKTSRTMETDLSDYPSPVPHSPVASKSPTDSHAMESGYFNKYAIEEAERKADPAEAKAQHPATKSGSEIDRKRSEAKRAERLDPESDPDAEPNPKDGKGPRSPRYSTKSAGSRLSRLAEQDEIDYEDDYVYDEEYTYSDEDEAENHHNKPVPIWLSILLVVGYIFGGAFMFSSWEEWSFLNSAYFCFITLTTIGFGDFVPAQKVKENVEVSIALCSLYLLFGIALLAMSFNLVQEEVINSVKSVAKRLGIIKEEDDDEG